MKLIVYHMTFWRFISYKTWIEKQNVCAVGYDVGAGCRFLEATVTSYGLAVLTVADIDGGSPEAHSGRRLIWETFGGKSVRPIRLKRC